MTAAGPAGATALDAVVAAMDRLRSSGGCPWDAEQTHRSLAPYAIEEAYELAEAAEGEDRAALRSELGDLLLQVVFHARVAEEHPSDPFALDDVAQVLLDKLVRRHPHVFGDAADVISAADVEAAWHTIKQQERGGQIDVLAGIPLALPALARAQKTARRLRREGATDAELLAADEVPPSAEGQVPEGQAPERPAPGGQAPAPPSAEGQAPEGQAVDASSIEAEAELGRELMALVLRAEAAGVDAEAALRGHLRRIPTRRA